jgi:hypothetical protein
MITNHCTVYPRHSSEPMYIQYKENKKVSLFIFHSVASNQGVGTDEGWIYLAFSVILFSRRRDSFSTVLYTLHINKKKEEISKFLASFFSAYFL